MRSKAYQLTPNKFLNDSEVEALLLKLPQLSERDQVFFLLLLHTGARVSEIRNVTINDFDKATSSAFITGLKGSRDRAIPLDLELINRALALDIDANGHTFPFGLRQADNLWHSVRPCKKALKSLRHTFAVRLYRKTRDLKLVQYALGHVSITNTAIYTEMDMSDELRRVLLAS